jgi:hypothetical protein
MAERRTLVEGLARAPEERAKEEAFVFGQPRTTAPPAVAAVAPAEKDHLGRVVRVPLTTRIRPELAAALKRVSLQRQLEGTHPCAMQDLVEDALELWLLKNTPPA